jgi:hypothetical protein
VAATSTHPGRHRTTCDLKVARVSGRPRAVSLWAAASSGAAAHNHHGDAAAFAAGPSCRLITDVGYQAQGPRGQSHPSLFGKGPIVVQPLTQPLAGDLIERSHSLP